jgi:hypothetical protein
MSKIAIVLLTAGTSPERTQYARATLYAVLARLDTDSHDLRLYIGDDGSPHPHVAELLDIAETHGYSDYVVANSGGIGYGANYNLIMKEAHMWADYILPLEDDWELTRAFNIDPIVHVLADGVFDSVRMGYIGYTQPLYAKFVYHCDRHYLHLLDTSEEPHVFSGHPRLETVEYQKRVGPWPEGLTPGETEWTVATTMPEARKKVGYPLWAAGDVKNGIFAHIGTMKSY